LPRVPLDSTNTSALVLSSGTSRESGSAGTMSIGAHHEHVVLGEASTKVFTASNALTDWQTERSRTIPNDIISAPALVIRSGGTLESGSAPASSVVASGIVVVRGHGLALPLGTAGLELVGNHSRAHWIVGDREGGGVGARWIGVERIYLLKGWNEGHDSTDRGSVVTNPSVSAKVAG